MSTSADIATRIAKHGNLLDRILNSVQQRVTERQERTSFAQLEKQALMSARRQPLRLARHLEAHPLAIIAEAKRASPSEGILQRDLDVAALARRYVQAGAVALSVLSEPDFFSGSLQDLAAAKAACPETPVLMKDFILHEYQILEGYAAGADAILLICSALSETRLQELLKFAESLGLTALVEVHDEAELDSAAAVGASLIGVNNRNLGTLEISLQTSFRLAPRAPKNAVLVSESGLRERQDLMQLRNAGYRGFLVGTHFLKSTDPSQSLKEFIGGQP